MTYSLRYTPRALADMDSVWNGVYEASKSLDVADKYVREFATEIGAKKQFPFSGTPLLYSGLFTGFYSIGYKKYRAFYRVNANCIEVIRILLAKSDYLAILL